MHDLAHDKKWSHQLVPKNICQDKRKLSPHPPFGHLLPHGEGENMNGKKRQNTAFTENIIAASPDKSGLRVRG